MTDLPQTIARLRELMKKADPLPWSTVNDSEAGEAEIYCHWHEVGPLSLKGKSINDNSKLVHAAVNALPDLLAILESSATAPVVVVDEDAIATALRSAVSIIKDLYSCEPIEEQHDDTGYIWSGPRWQTPLHYTEFSNAAGVPPEEMARILSEFKSALGQGDAHAKETK